jgi:hypothetical protein
MNYAAFTKTSVPLFFVILFLYSCQSITSPTQIPTASQTNTQTFTSTKTPTKTNTPTITLTATESPTQTTTFTKTLIYNLPGMFYIYKCATFYPFTEDPKAYVMFCVQSVRVYPNFTMQFNVTWVLGGVSNTFSHYVKANKNTDPTNHCNFLVDNLGNEYSHIGVGGAAANSDVVGPDKPSSGWFLFPPAKLGATSFTFRSICDGIEVGGIVLLPK